MSLVPTTRTGLQVANFVKRQFGDEAGVQITDSDILAWINSGQIEICERNKVLKARSVTDIVGGQSAYPLSTLDIMHIESLHYNGGVLPGQEFAQAQETIDNATSGTGATDIHTHPLMWYEWAGEINLWPTPQQDIASGLKVFYTKYPTDLVTLNQTLSLPDRYYEMLCSWVMSKAYELDESFTEADTHRAYFERGLDTRNEEERTAFHITYPTITIVE